ncbi:hypothetical protein I553_7346 [Mycobacterium xenopi 4042]|uniref:Uncharacterized protein n=1 Tax=Mycobacterium xenopi 4042 TaxID=1299334 RepID=X8E6Y2_MYCXE|nr:hypothetical protein I552_4934 [Mycobacterium xenopi 3993]EUA76319.1 hypothetical protein I553_7346 [Mycobacterium xenopi 4042]
MPPRSVEHLSHAHYGVIECGYPTFTQPGSAYPPSATGTSETPQ